MRTPADIAFAWCGVLATSAFATASTVVTDTTPPMITSCPSDLTLAAGPSCAPPMPDLRALVSASDDSGVVTITQSPVPGATLALGTIVMTFTATDPTGNFTTCSANLTVDDLVAPTISACPPDTTLPAGPNCAATLPDLRAQLSASDACGGITVTQAPPAGAALSLGVTNVTFTVRDSSDNVSTCTAHVTVSDADSDGDGVANCEDSCPLGGAGANGVRLSEIYVNHAGTDTLEFIELHGAPGASLACSMLLVVDGDGVNAGILDRAIDLSSFTIPASGYFVMGDSAVGPNQFDLGARDGIENGTCTIYLVTTSHASVLSSLVGRRIATGTGTSAIPSLCTIIDAVGIADAGFPTLDSIFDGATVVGPDATFLPAGTVRCGNAPFGWSNDYLRFDPQSPTSGVAPTPGAPNPDCDPGLAFCFGDGAQIACPCGNESPAGEHVGCLNSGGKGGKLRAIGTASIANDTVVLTGAGMLAGPALYFQGTDAKGGGAGTLFGDGLRCASGTVVRIATVVNVAGNSSYPPLGGAPISTLGVVTTPVTRHYQILYRNTATFCTSDTFNLSNGWTVNWVP